MGSEMCIRDSLYRLGWRCMQGLLVAAVLRVMEALATTGCHDSIDHERCATHLPVRSTTYPHHGMLRATFAAVSCLLALEICCSCWVCSNITLSLFTTTRLHSAANTH